MRRLLIAAAMLCHCLESGSNDLEDYWNGSFEAARENPVGALVNPIAILDPTGLPNPGNSAQALVDNPEALWEYIRDPRQLVGAPLSEIIRSARNRAIRGSQAMPPHIRSLLTGVFPDNVLDNVRWTAEWGVLNSVPVAITNGCAGARATTLIDVVVFQEGRLAYDATLWVHELTHVGQYRELGLPEFARQYTTDYNRIEGPAYNNENHFRRRSENQQTRMNQPQPATFSYGQRCEVNGGQCGLAYPSPLGTACYCLDVYNRPWPGIVR